MALIKISRNYQVTLPAKLRSDLDLKEGDYLDVSVKNGAFVLSPVEAVRVLNKNTKDTKKK